MRTHAEILTILRAQESILKDQFGISEMGLVSVNVEYKPVLSVCLFVSGLEPTGFGRLSSYLNTELGVSVEVIEKTKANGSFRYAFSSFRRSRQE